MSDLIIGDDEFDLDQLLNDPDFLNDVNFLDESPGQVSDSNPDQQKLAEVEQLLMNDDFDNDKGDDFLLGVLLDSPVESEASRGEVFDGSVSKTSSPEAEVENRDKDDNEGEGNDIKESDDGEKDDPITKKRKRYFMILDDFLDSIIEC